MMVVKRNLLFQGAIFGFHVKLWEGMRKLSPVGNAWKLRCREVDTPSERGMCQVDDSSKERCYKGTPKSSIFNYTSRVFSL